MDFDEKFNSLDSMKKSIQLFSAFFEFIFQSKFDSPFFEFNLDKMLAMMETSNTLLFSAWKIESD